MNRTILGLVILIIIMGGIYWYFVMKRGGEGLDVSEFKFPVMPVADFNRLMMVDQGEGLLVWDDKNKDGTFILPDGSIDEKEFSGRDAKKYLGKKAGKYYFLKPFEPIYLSMVEKLRQEKISEELKLTFREPIVTDVIARVKEYPGVSEQEVAFYRDGIKKLMEAAPIVQALYQKQIGTSPDDRIKAETNDDRELFDRYGHPWCLGDTSDFCVAIPSLPKRTSNVIPGDVSCDIASSTGSPFEVIVRDEAGNLISRPYSEAWLDEHSDIAESLRDAAQIFEKIPREAQLSAYLKGLADAFESKEPYPYYKSDELWNKMLSSDTLIFARIGADEVGNDPVGDRCESKARYHFNLGFVNKSVGALVEKIKPAIDRLEKHFADIIGDSANYVATPIQVQLPVFIDVIFSNGDDVGGPAGTPIGQTLPNWIGADGKGEGMHGTMIYVNKTVKAYSEKIMKKFIMPLFVPEVQTYFSSSAGPEATVYHEIFHNIGPRESKKKPGKDVTYGQGLVTKEGVSWKSAIEELKAQTGSLFMASEFYKDAIEKHEKGEMDDATFAKETKLYKEHITYDIAWALRMILRASRSGPEFNSTNPYSRLSAVQIGFLVEKGALKFDIAKKQWSIDFDKMPDAVNALMKKLGQLYVRSDANAVGDFFTYYTKGNGEKLLHRDVLVEVAGKMPSVLFDYQLKGL